MIVGTLTGSIAVAVTRSPVTTVAASTFGLLLSLWVLYWPRDGVLLQSRCSVWDKLMDLASERVQCNQRRASLKAQLDASQSRLTEVQRQIRDAEKINSIQLRRERLVTINPAFPR